MRRLVILLFLAMLAWQGYGAYQARSGEGEFDGDSAQLLRDEIAAGPGASFRCDGRVHCSQMTSCEEAEFFLANCPGVKMDGGGDGVPCERQWCGDR